MENKLTPEELRKFLRNTLDNAPTPDDSASGNADEYASLQDEFLKRVRAALKTSMTLYRQMHAAIKDLPKDHKPLSVFQSTHNACLSSRMTEQQRQHNYQTIGAFAFAHLVGEDGAIVKLNMQQAMGTNSLVAMYARAILTDRGQYLANPAMPSHIRVAVAKQKAPQKDYDHAAYDDLDLTNQLAAQINVDPSQIGELHREVIDQCVQRGFQFNHLVAVITALILAVQTGVPDGNVSDTQYNEAMAAVYALIKYFGLPQEMVGALLLIAPGVMTTPPQAS